MQDKVLPDPHWCYQRRHPQRLRQAIVRRMILSHWEQEAGH